VTRGFIAIRPPDVVLDAIEARVAGIVVAGARPTPRDQWHLTLQFLGNDADIASIEQALTREPLASVAGDVRLGGVTSLGSPRRARVLALGVHEGAPLLAALATSIERRLAPLGYVRDADDRAFIPHLTLGRFREPTDIRSVRAALGDEPVGPSWPLVEIVLFESRLVRKGAEHIVRAQFPVSC
jgi:RNA 2',3'-cyclic 3'-phosphodiesterase